MVTQDYMSLLQGNYPPALVIFAHFTTLCGFFRNEWCCTGYAERSLDVIFAALPEKWQNLLVWPRQQLDRDMRDLINQSAEALGETTNEAK